VPEPQPEPEPEPEPAPPSAARWKQVLEKLEKIEALVANLPEE
jgi:hypothetical protein